MRTVGTCAAFTLLCAAAVSAQTVDVLDFESVSPGCVVGSIDGAGGTGPVVVVGVNPDIPGENVAVIFDSSNPSGGDVDLGTPNETCAMPGPGVGAAGEVGSPFENCIPKGNLLIIDEHGGAVADAACAPEGRIADPDDGDAVGSLLNFDFSALGSVFIDSITILDTEEDEEDPAVVTLYDGGMAVIMTVSLPTPGNNGVAKVALGDIPGVVFMDVILNGSGAIDDVVFCLCDDGDPCTIDTCVDGECFNTPKVCDDGDACTMDGCDEMTGECVYTEIVCDDMDDCTEDECVDGVCVYTLIVCDDGDDCTTDECVDGVCVYTPIVCDDGDDCTTDECVDGVCVYTLIVCDDGDACTEDECVDGQCVYTPIDCDDGDPCTDDFCEDGECFNVDNGTCGGGEGCTPGFWKGPGNDCQWVGYSPDDDYETVFGVDASFTKTLEETLAQGGGGEKALGRHAVAALLNASSGDVSYAFSEAAVIALVQEAYDNCSSNGCFNSYKAQLEAENEPTPCPIDACQSRERGPRGR